MSQPLIKILAISGSIRANSSNTKILQYLGEQTRANVDFSIYQGLDKMPHFNPDLDQEGAFASVEDFRMQLKHADGVIICTPEFAKGVPGTLKNALDWIVSSGEFIDKPTAVISASPMPSGGQYAHDSLLLTLEMINAKIVEGGTLHIPFVTTKLNEQGEVTDAETIEDLQSVLRALLKISHNPNIHL